MPALPVVHTYPLADAVTAASAVLPHVSKDDVTPVTTTAQVSHDAWVATDRFTVGRYAITRPHEGPLADIAESPNRIMVPREALAQTHHVKTIAELADARRDLTQTIADVLGVTLKDVKLPHAHLVLANGAGVALTRWADDQRDHVRAAVKANGLGNFHLSISPDIQRGVLAAWEARQ